MWDVAVLGSLNVDIAIDVDELPVPGETVHGRAQRRAPGGKGANQAVAAANFGARVAMIGGVGPDLDGTFLLDALTAHQISTEFVRRHETAPTGTAHILVNSHGQNTIVVLGGANLEIEDDIPEVAASVYLGQLETPIPALEIFYRKAPVGACRVLNGAPADLAARRLFPLVDVLILNEPELATFAAVEAIDSIEDARCAAEIVRHSPQQTIVVTLGSRGAVAITGDKCFVYSAPTVEVVDTTGAGDCFCGVFAAELAAGVVVDRAISQAVIAASLAVTRKGAIPAMPRREEL